MRAADAYDYAVIRVVPRVEREEFINAGVILSCERSGYLEARIELDEARLRALAPGIDMESVRRHLNTLPAICAGGPDSGPIGQLPLRARFHWLTARRSSIIQTSPAHTGKCTDMAAVMERLLEQMVRTPHDRSTP
jgi:hypothetical protein